MKFGTDSGFVDVILVSAYLFPGSNLTYAILTLNAVLWVALWSLMELYYSVVYP